MHLDEFQWTRIASVSYTRAEAIDRVYDAGKVELLRQARGSAETLTMNSEHRDPQDRPPLVTVASEHGAGGDVVAPGVAEALGVAFLDRALPADPAAPEQRPHGVLGSVARASTVLGGESVERLDPAEAQVTSELAEFLTRARSAGGVVLGRGGVVVLGDAAGVLHVLLTGSVESRIARVAAREGIALDEAEARVQLHDRARRDYVRRTFGVESDDRKLYHLIVDTMALGIDAAIELVAAAARARARSER